MMAPSNPCTDAHLLPLPSFFPDGSLAVAMNFVNKYSMQVLRVCVGGYYRRGEGDRGRRYRVWMGDVNIDRVKLEMQSS